MTSTSAVLENLPQQQKHTKNVLLHLIATKNRCLAIPSLSTLSIVQYIQYVQKLDQLKIL